MVVYLYNSEPEDLIEKATNGVWSKILFDVKNSKGGEVVLIPVAVDSDLVSLNSKLSNFNITDFPVVVIDDEIVLTELNSAEDLESYLV